MSGQSFTTPETKSLNSCAPGKYSLPPNLETSEEKSRYLIKLIFRFLRLCLESPTRHQFSDQLALYKT